MNPIDVTQLRQRRLHEKIQGCAASPSRLIDSRCLWCKDFDAAQNLLSRLGWRPSDADRVFLKTLRISA